MNVTRDIMHLPQAPKCVHIAAEALTVIVVGVPFVTTVPLDIFRTRVLLSVQPVTLATMPVNRRVLPALNVLREHLRPMRARLLVCRCGRVYLLCRGLLQID